ncbi:hypothetical protein H2248_008847 [Termitomyces sp. 'cryptogamus']|nr:hypothetical protein H2248_008847 [Termitomyces sp. 'cryptogamus']
MSDEYASTGYKGSLVNPSLNEAPNTKQEDSNRERGDTRGRQSGRNFDYQTLNYPASGDSTAEGGYGSSMNVWSGRAQRGNRSGTGTYTDGTLVDAGLTDQGKDGEPLGDQFDHYRVASSD